MKSHKKQVKKSKLSKHSRSTRKVKKSIRKNRKQLGKGMDKTQLNGNFSEDYGIFSPKSYQNIRGLTNFANSPYYYMVSKGDTGIKNIYKVRSPDPSATQPSQEKFIDVYLYIPSENSVLIKISDSRGIYVVTPEYLENFINQCFPKKK